MEHYFSAQPTVNSEPFSYECQVEGKTFVFQSDRGVFSGKNLDPGSRLLLETFIRERRQIGKTEGRLLDLGCGIGCLGIIAKRCFPALELTMVDVNERALHLAEQNAKANGAAAICQLSDGWSALEGQHYDFVLSNPPIRAGKSVVYAFFAGAYAQLNPGGELYIVIRKQQGAESAARELKRLFGENAVERLARDHGYHIYRAQR